ncbi:hypothetical protein BDV59DRAFT_98366 [Aspergillus ambiguus]|uniref:uncharacterized protein n=1 Tax=Aspergillus ambiguus TaxID=176160 RepID=UPI003CCD547E
MRGSQSSQGSLSGVDIKRRSSLLKSTPKKRKSNDPAYVPIKDEDSSDDGNINAHLGFRTPKPTLQKRKAVSDPGGTPETKKKLPPYTPEAIKNTIQVTPSSYGAPKRTSNTMQPTFKHPLAGSRPVKNTRRASSKPTIVLYSPSAVSSDSGETTDNDPLSAMNLGVGKKKRDGEEDMNAFVPDNSDDDNDDHSTFRVSKSEKTTIVFDFSLEKAKRWAEAINLPQGVYNSEESDLFFRLAMRGFEPLVPRQWKYDFPTLPELLFPSPEDESGSLIRAFRGSEFYGIKSLAHLFSLGGRVRDCSILRIRPEPLIKRSVVRYIRWAIRDAKLLVAKNSIPVHAIYDQKKGETTLSSVKKLNQRLQLLASRHRKSLNPAFAGAPPSPQTSEGSGTSSVSDAHPNYPLLTGFVICGPIIAILTFGTDPGSGGANNDSKFISQFDLSERGQDVWNSLAIAITTMHIRRTMMQLSQDGLGGFSEVQRDDSPISDADI